MKKNKTVLAVYTALAALLGLAGAYFRHILISEFTDEELGLYKLGTAVPEAFWIYIASCLLFALSAIVMTRRSALPRSYRPRSLLSSIACALVGTGLLYTAVVFFKNNKSSVGRTGDALTLYRFETVCSVLAIISFVYFVAEAFSRIFDSAGEWVVKTRKVLSLSPVLWASVRLMAVYFDRTLMLNHPVRIFHQTTLILLVFFTLVGARMQVGKAKPVLFVTVSLFALVCMLTWTVPELTEVISEGSLLTYRGSHIALEFALALLIISRLIDYARLAGETVLTVSGDGRTGKGGPRDDEENEAAPEEDEIIFEENDDNGDTDENDVGPLADGDEAVETGNAPEESAENDFPFEQSASEETEDENVNEEDDDSQLTFDQLLTSDNEEAEKTGNEASPEVEAKEDGPKDETPPADSPEQPEEDGDQKLKSFLEDLSRRLDRSSGVKTEDAPSEKEVEKNAPEQTEAPGENGREEARTGETPERQENSIPKRDIDLSDNDILKYISELTGEKLEIERPEPEIRPPEESAVSDSKGEYSLDEILRINFEHGMENRRNKSGDKKD